ncbi:MAG TPA: hypothetical protein VF212_10445 [Longimicrobiales bacterium]
MERERIEIPAKLLRDETDALATVVEDYYSKLTGLGLPKDVADRLILDFHTWMLSNYRITSERQ